MIPAWLHILAVVSVALGVVCAAAIAADELRCPQPMWIMNVVWPVTALFGLGLTLWLYAAYGRPQRRGAGAGGAAADPPAPRRPVPFAIRVAKGAYHCGSGCTLGDICAEWLAVAFPAIAVALGWKWVFAERIFAVWVLDYLLAFLFGIAFQYFTIVPMRGLRPWPGIREALKADILSLTAWQIGMYGFMALAYFRIFGAALGIRLQTSSFAFWFMMQIAMLCGLATSYPVNWWLIRAGIKDAM